MPASDRKHLDVIRPGKSAASATTRPVIVGHGAMMKDPMLQTEQKPSANETQIPAAEEEKPVVQRTKVVVRPLSDADKNEAQQSNSEGMSASLEPEATPPVEAPQKDAEEDEVSDQAVVDAVASQATAGKGQKKAQEEQAKQEAIQKLITDKTYVLPIAKARRTSSGRGISIVVSLLLLLVVGGYLLLDAGIIGNNVKLPLDLIKQSSAVTADNTPPVAPAPRPAVTAASSTTLEASKAYSSTVNGVAFSYPNDWTVAEAKDEARPGVTNITVKSPAQDITPGMGAKSEEVAMVLTIAVENTTSTTRYTSKWDKLTFCSTESVALTKQTSQYYIAYVSKESSKDISALILSQKQCDATASTTAMISDQVQFATKKDTYTVTGQYQYTDAYKKSNPAASQTAPAYSLDTFRGAKQAVAIIQSLHEL